MCLANIKSVSHFRMCKGVLKNLSSSFLHTIIFNYITVVFTSFITHCLISLVLLLTLQLRIYFSKISCIEMTKVVEGNILCVSTQDSLCVYACVCMCMHVCAHVCGFCTHCFLCKNIRKIELDVVRAQQIHWSQLDVAIHT